jgi:hypothetical protein
MAVSRNKTALLSEVAINEGIDLLLLEADPLEVAIIGLTKGYKAIVDKRFEDLVRQHKWFACKTSASVYAKSSSVVRTVRPQTQVALHNFIVSHYIKGIFDPTLKHTTFDNKNPLDCRIANLLKGNSRQAVMRNRRGKQNSLSKFKGVRLMGGKYRAFIYDGCGNVSLGSWDEERKAAMIYDAAAFLLFGASAHYNLPLGSLETRDHELASRFLRRHYSKLLGRQVSEQEVATEGFRLTLMDRT